MSRVFYPFRGGRNTTSGYTRGIGAQVTPHKISDHRTNKKFHVLWYGKADLHLTQIMSKKGGIFELNHDVSWKNLLYSLKDICNKA